MPLTQLSAKRIAALGAAALACCGVPFAMGAGGGNTPRGGGISGTQVEILGTSQAKLLSSGKLKVSVESVDRRANLSARSKTTNGKRRRIASSKVVRVTREPKTFRLRLTSRGLRRVAKCKPRILIAEANTFVNTDVGSVDKDREDLVLDSAPCEPPPDTPTRVYGIEPGGEATHTNDTPRDLAATDTGADSVRLELFGCNGLSDENGDVAFQHSGGVATRGNPAGSFTSVEGSATTGSPQKAGPLSAGSGDLDFTISGRNGCATPVVFKDKNSNSGLDVDSDGVPTEPYGAGGQTSWEPQGAQFQNAGRCDPLDPAVCLQPFPNDHFTIADPTTDTGKRVAFAEQSMPANRAGVRINPTEWNRNDGFSPGQAIITRVPGLDTPAAFPATDPVPITDIERSFDEDAPIVVIDADTGERHLIWSEIDANPANPADVNLFIRPAVNFEEGHRYVVALRDLRRADGSVIEPQRPFELYRDRIRTSDAAVEARRGEFEENFEELEDAGIDRDDLYLAWDFTVGSERSLSERALSIRDDAFSQLGDTNLADLEVQGQTPSVQITSVTDFDECGNDGCQDGSPVFEALPLGPGDIPLVGDVTGPTEAQLSTFLGEKPENDRIIRKVEGQVVVPCYTNGPGCQTGTQFAYSGPTDTIPNRIPGNTTLANFICVIPRSAVSGGTVDPVKPSLYGHGLLGGAGEVNAGNIAVMANDHGFMFCATDWAGFATQDLPTIGLILQDLNNFPKLVDRSQQGFLNFMFLGRAIIHSQGFSSSPAFKLDGQSLIDTERLYYDGNSQGGILGGSLVALEPDLERAVLGVPGMNYSTLLRRSVDFAPYAEGEFLDGTPNTEAGLYDNYPSELERPLILGLIQMLWDRGENNGYAHHMTSDPLANTPPHEVLMQVAFGDHQVTMWTADVLARTVGASTTPNVLDPGRHPDDQPLFGIPRIASFPFSGSALIYVDAGTPAPPITNTPPAGDEFGDDPHGVPRSDPEGQAQKAAFLSPNGTVVDTCDGAPCHGGGYTGPPAP
ncbi:MAG: hypothetical protein M3355_00775 [Actinomycetota bacterium]|nr:hypothetical protein [Actinomycetota bacterium]